MEIPGGGRKDKPCEGLQVTWYFMMKTAALTRFRLKCRYGTDRWRWVVFGVTVTFVYALLIVGCLDMESERTSDYVMRLGDQVVTVLDFNTAFEIVKTAYPYTVTKNSDALKAARRRLLHQMTEEMILLQRAGELEIGVTDVELDKAIANIKKDYPEGTFEKTLLESAVSYNAWVKRLKTRLIMEKVVEKELEEKIVIQPEDVAQYYETHYKSKGLDSESQRLPEGFDEMIVKLLRKKKAEEAYEDWIKKLQQNYTIEINRTLWNKLAGS